MLLIRIERGSLWVFWGFWVPYYSSRGKVGFFYFLLFKLPILYLSGPVNGEVTLEAKGHSEVYPGSHCTIMLLQPL